VIFWKKRAYFTIVPATVENFYIGFIVNGREALVYPAKGQKGPFALRVGPKPIKFFVIGTKKLKLLRYNGKLTGKENIY
jgi:hypothetical protein